MRYSLMMTPAKHCKRRSYS